MRQGDESSEDVAVSLGEAQLPSGGVPCGERVEGNKSGKHKEVVFLKTN